MNAVDYRNDFRFQTRPGTVLDRVQNRPEPKRHHTGNRERGRRLTKPGTIERRWNMKDYYGLATGGFNFGEGHATGQFIPYRS